jgi:hypothetical protein
MHINLFRNVKLASLVLILVTLACSSGQSATLTPVSTNTSIPPSDTPVPTSTLKPTNTPDLAATKDAETDQVTLQKYVDSGYLSTTDGTIYPLNTTTFEMAQINYLNYQEAGASLPVTDFAFWGDVKWSSAGPVNSPEFSGCGIAFRVGSNIVDGYSAMLTNDSVLVTWCFAALGNHCGRVGKTRGKGTVKFGNPAEAHFEFITNKGHAYALVNGEFTAEYTLFQDRLTQPGLFAYSIISGTNRDYGTRCTIDNAKLWVPNN